MGAVLNTYIYMYTYPKLLHGAFGSAGLILEDAGVVSDPGSPGFAGLLSKASAVHSRGAARLSGRPIRTWIRSVYTVYIYIYNHI